MKFLNLFFILCLLSACKTEKQEITEAVSEDEEIAIPSDFISFYDHFHSDSLFQLNHIVFPLTSVKDNKVHNRDNWILHKPFNSQGGSFVRGYRNLNGIIIEFVREKTGFMTIERRFSKMNGEYHLIYYDTESQFGSSD